MLYISFQLKETTLRYTKSYFDFNYDDDWFNDDDTQCGDPSKSHDSGLKWG